MSESQLSLDLRPLLAAGTDPLAGVVEQAGRLHAGSRMDLRVPFNPLPLRRVLARMGYSSWPEKLAEGDWRIHLIRDGEGRVEGEPDPADCAGLPTGAPTWRDGQGLHIDVRGLPMPLPMLAVLRLLGSPESQGDSRLWLHHERDPMFLYPELAEIGWMLEPKGQGPEGELLFLAQREGD